MLDVHLLGEQLIAGGSDVGYRPPSSRSIALLTTSASTAPSSAARSCMTWLTPTP